MGPGPFGLLGVFISSVTGCVGIKSAGSTCYDIDYAPGVREYPDSDFERIRKQCRLDQVASWDRAHERVLNFTKTLSWCPQAPRVRSWVGLLILAEKTGKSVG